MALQTSLTFGFDLTQFIPSGFIRDTTIELAKRLRRGGSDLVAENELNLFLGRALLADATAKSFRYYMTRNENRYEHLCGQIGLMIGPGPTVQQAIVEGIRSSRFSMIVQCSLLTTMHTVDDLAAVLADSFRNYNYDILSRRQTPNPSGNSNFQEEARHLDNESPLLTSDTAEIAQVLRTVRDHTVEFDWRRDLQAVALVLGLAEHYMFETIPRKVLECMVRWLPVASRQPDDTLATIDVTSGTCAIVAWAHHVLGLNVTVRLITSDDIVKYRFGKDCSQVEVRVHLNKLEKDYTIPIIHPPATFTLLSRMSEHKFTLRADESDEVISCVRRGPLRGFARRMMISSHPASLAGEQKLPVRITSFAAAVACLVAQRSRVSHVAAYSLFDSAAVSVDFDPLELPPEIDKIIGSARLLFDDPKIEGKDVQELMDHFRGKSLTDLHLDDALLAHCNTWPANLDEPDRLRKAKRYQDKLVQLSAVILSCSRILDLQCCSELSLSESYSGLSATEFSHGLVRWDGKSMINLRACTFFELISELFEPDSSFFDIVSTSMPVLRSTHGWSILLPTLSNSLDPLMIEKGTFLAKRGVPYNNETWRRNITDLHQKPPQEHLYTWRSPLPESNASNNALLYLGPRKPMRIDHPYCGTYRDSFIVRLHLFEPEAGDEKRAKPGTLRRTSYMELYESLWSTTITKPCSHPLRHQDRFIGTSCGEETRRAMTLVLPPECKVLAEFGDANDQNEGDAPEYPSVTPKKYICLTAAYPVDKNATRWRALVAIEAFRDQRLPRGEYWPILLKGRGCCYKCAVEQLCQQRGNWFLVL